jgi:hypothetical protein
MYPNLSTLTIKVHYVAPYRRQTPMVTEEKQANAARLTYHHVTTVTRHLVTRCGAEVPKLTEQEDSRFGRIVFTHQHN